MLLKLIYLFFNLFTSILILNAIGHVTLSSHILHVLFHVALKNCYCTCYPNIFIFAQSEDERRIRARAVYYTNIDKKITQEISGSSLNPLAERFIACIRLQTDYIPKKMAYDMFVKILH